MQNSRLCLLSRHFTKIAGVSQLNMEGFMIDSTGRNLRLKLDDIVWREVDNELVVLELSTSTYLTLNGSAKLLWETLTEGSTIERLVLSLVGRYSLPPDQARFDVTAFILTLSERNLIEYEP